MDTEVKTLSPKAFTHAFGEAEKYNRRFCFILGAGASRQAGISTGVEMAKEWASQLPEKYEKEELKMLMEKLGIDSIEPSSKNYFGIYDLRFYTDYQEGYAFFERELENANPSLGHQVLAKILAGKTHNLAITTNFDSLIEDALFIYTDKRPLVVGHESLAQFINLNVDRPIVAKVHRSLYYHPFNQQKEVNELAEEWKDKLKDVFRVYTPIVIGYAGGDQSLMKFLRDENVKMDKIYWCYWNKEEPSEEIKELVKSKNGYLVPIESFDYIMFMLSRRLGIENPGKEMEKITKDRIERYNLQYDEFEKRMREESSKEEFLSSVVEEMDSLNKQRLKDVENEETFEAYAEKGRIYARTEKYEEAIQAFTKALELNPQDSVTYYNRGLAYSMVDEGEKAIEDYTKALELNPQYSSAYNNRGVVYNELGENEKAIEDYTKALEINPKYSDAYYNRGFSYSALGENEKAIEDYTEAIRINAQHSAAYYNRGYVYDELGENEKALEDYTKAIEISPKDSDAYYNRGLIYRTLGQHKKAEEDMKKAKELEEKG